MIAYKNRWGFRSKLMAHGDEQFSMFLREIFIKAMGYSDDALDRPVIGITNTSNGYSSCHQTVPQLIDAVQRGIMHAGGLPVVFPTIAPHEAFAYPTGMLYRNLMSMDTEEMIRGQSMDAVVMISGCDNTVPAQIMGAVSANTPAILVVTGPMMAGSYRGERVGACTDCRRLWSMHRAAEIGEAEVRGVSDKLAPTAGTCGVMGTASTMACISEALGLMLPGGSCIPAVTADRLRHAEFSGRRAVELAKEGLTPDRILTPKAITNALRILMALGGSANCLIHVAAIAGRLGIRIDLDAVDQMGRETPVLVDLKPLGKFFMEDLQRAGGMLPLFRELREMLHLDCTVVTGRTLGEEIDSGGLSWPQEVVRPLSAPFHQHGGLAVLRGNLAPEGAVLKLPGASPNLLLHTGKALVFESVEDLATRIDDPQLEVTAADILVLRNAGPKGSIGMPEAGQIPIPQKLARQGVTDMVRISDARMSGTGSGTVILHVSPEAAMEGPLSRLRTGDIIELDVPNRRLNVLLEHNKFAARRPNIPAESGVTRGYQKLYLDHVLQAGDGCDLDFLIRRPFQAVAPVGQEN
jgi:dihydroxy-acid dehydratase